MGVWVGQRSGVLSRAAPAASSHGGEARRQRQWQSNDKRAEHQLRELVNTCSNTVAKLMLQSNGLIMKTHKYPLNVSLD